MANHFSFVCAFIINFTFSLLLFVYWALMALLPFPTVQIYKMDDLLLDMDILGYYVHPPASAMPFQIAFWLIQLWNG